MLDQMGKQRNGPYHQGIHHPLKERESMQQWAVGWEEL